MLVYVQYPEQAGFACFKEVYLGFRAVPQPEDPGSSGGLDRAVQALRSKAHRGDKRPVRKVPCTGNGARLRAGLLLCATGRKGGDRIGDYRDFEESRGSRGHSFPGEVRERPGKEVGTQHVLGLRPQPTNQTTNRRHSLAFGAEHAVSTVPSSIFAKSRLLG